MTIRLPAGERYAVPGRVDGLLRPGRPGAEPRRVVEVVAVRQAAVAEARPALAGVPRVELLGRGDLVGVDPEQDHVVHDVAVVGLDERAGQEAVLRQVRVEQEAAVVVGADAVRSRRRGTPSASAAPSGSRPAAAARGFTAATGCGLLPDAGGRGRGRRGIAPAARGRAAVAEQRRAPARPPARPRPPRPRRRRRARSAGWPRLRPSGQHVQVGVEHRLPGVRPGVEHQPVAVVAGVGRRPDGPRATSSATVAGSRVGELGGVRRRACAGRRARAAAPAGSGRGTRARPRSRATTSAGISPATIRQNRQSSTRAIVARVGDASRSKPRAPGARATTVIGHAEVRLMAPPEPGVRLERRRGARAAVRRALAAAGPPRRPPRPRRRAPPRRSCRTASSPCTPSGTGCTTPTRRWPTSGRASSTAPGRTCGTSPSSAGTPTARRRRSRPPGADHAAYDLARRATVLDALRTPAAPPARGARPALLPRPLRGGDRRHSRDQPRRGQEPRLARRRRPARPARPSPRGDPMNDDDDDAAPAALRRGLRHRAGRPARGAPCLGAPQPPRWSRCPTASLVRRRRHRRAR